MPPMGAQASNASLASSLRSRYSTTFSDAGNRASQISTDAEFLASSTWSGLASDYDSPPGQGTIAPLPVLHDTHTTPTTNEPPTTTGGRRSQTASSTRSAHQCVYCGTTVKKNNDFRRHLLNICPLLGDGTKALRCHLCSHLVRTESQAKQHCLEVHHDHITRTRLLREKHGPEKYGYARIDLPGKTRFTCLCQNGKVHPNVDKLLEHLNSSSCSREGHDVEAHRHRFLALMSEGQDPQGHHTGYFAEALRYFGESTTLLATLPLIREVPIDEVRTFVNRLEWGLTNHYALADLHNSSIFMIVRDILGRLIECPAEQLVAFDEPKDQFWDVEGNLNEQDALTEHFDSDLSGFGFGTELDDENEDTQSLQVSSEHTQDNHSTAINTATASTLGPVVKVSLLPTIHEQPPLPISLTEVAKAKKRTVSQVHPDSAERSMAGPAGKSMMDVVGARPTAMAHAKTDWWYDLDDEMPHTFPNWIGRLPITR